MNTSIERLEEIENERAETFLDPSFEQWVRELNVSRMYVNREGLDRARQIMEQWTIQNTSQ